ncbi:MAG: tetratricopeptide repeat protein [Acidobacteriota bacterium]|nr:tetratricopeptide repeat protein [Acidobacteriota bacterium]
MSSRALPISLASAVVCTSATACQQTTWKQQIDAAVFAHQDGELEAAEDWFRAAERSARRFPPSDHRLALTLGNLADFFHGQARDTEAEPLYLEALKLLERNEGLDSTRVARFSADLAFFYTTLGRAEEAEPLYHQSLQTLERLHGTQGNEVILIRTALAGFYLDEQRYAEADTLYRELLTILSDAQNSQPDQLLAVLDEYAVLLHTTGRPEEATLLEARARALRATF